MTSVVLLFIATMVWILGILINIYIRNSYEKDEKKISYVVVVETCINDIRKINSRLLIAILIYTLCLILFHFKSLELFSYLGFLVMFWDIFFPIGRVFTFFISRNRYTFCVSLYSLCVVIIRLVSMIHIIK